jgi:hypothetical protein
MKTIEVTIVRRVATTYEYEVGDEFDVNAPGAFKAVEADYDAGEFGSNEETYEEVWNWDVDDVQEIE